MTCTSLLHGLLGLLWYVVPIAAWGAAFGAAFALVFWICIEISVRFFPLPKEP